VTEDLSWSCVYRFSTYEKANYCRHKRSYMFVKSPPWSSSTPSSFWWRVQRMGQVSQAPGAL